MFQSIVIKNICNDIGQGIFAIKRFNKGEVVISSEVIEEFAEPTKWTINNNEKHCLLTKPLILVNHSCNPNCKIVWDNKKCYLIATRNININKEINFNYTITENKITAFTNCMCASPNCQGKLSNYHSVNEYIDFSQENYIEEMKMAKLSIIDSLMNKKQLFFRGTFGIVVENTMDLMKEFFQSNAYLDKSVLSKDFNKNLYVAFTPYGFEKINNNNDLKTTLDFYPKNSSSYRYYKKKSIFLNTKNYIQKNIAEIFYQNIIKMNEALLTISHQIFQFLIEENILNLDKDFLIESIKNPNYLTRLIHYKPDIVFNYNQLSLGEHIDDDFFALVFNRSTRSSCLEILNLDNQWIEIQIPKYSFLLLPGRLLEFMSNGKIKAIKHRVRQIDNNERFTINFNYGLPEKYWNIIYKNRILSNFYFGDTDTKYLLSNENLKKV
jgi:isopenicillin N synthase-like dioxygenase